MQHLSHATQGAGSATAIAGPHSTRTRYTRGGRRPANWRCFPVAVALGVWLVATCACPQICNGLEAAKNSQSGGTVLRFVRPQDHAAPSLGTSTPALRRDKPASPRFGDPNPHSWTSENFRGPTRIALGTATQPARAAAPLETWQPVVPEQAPTSRGGDLLNALKSLATGQRKPAAAGASGVEPPQPAPRTERRRGVLSWLPWFGGSQGRETERR